jgi:hypothetical protein
LLLALVEESDQMTTQTRYFLRCSLLLLSVATVPSLAVDNTFKTFIDGPLVIEDQVFSGGTLDLIKIGNTNQTMAVRLDGRQIAIVYQESVALKTSIGATRKTLVMTKDQYGFYHLDGVTYQLVGDSRTSFRPLRIATLARGSFSTSDTAYIKTIGTTAATLAN